MKSSPIVFSIFVISLLALVSPIFAQELRCNVLLNTDQVQTQEKSILSQLQQNIQKFMNETRFTNQDYKENERIKCTLFITLMPQNTENPSRGTDVATGNYAATVQIQSLRPIYASTYESPMLLFFDQNFTFSYQPNQPLIFNENANNSNLTALLAFYSYIILALDADSFAEKSANPLIERILNITNNSQQSGAGWTNNDNRNRYWLSENLNSPQFIAFREAMYLYHRQGLDMFVKDAEGGRKKIIEALEKLKAINKLRPVDALLIDIFMDAKVNELIKIFGQGTPEMIKQATDIMVLLDPQNGDKYRALIK
jgi:hypothetical protein